MISLWKLREKKNVAQMPFVKNTPEQLKSQEKSQSKKAKSLSHQGGM